jgi:ureidoglycolate hydrolase
MNPRGAVMICDGGWGRMRREALDRAAQGIPSTLLVKVTPSAELPRLIRMIQPHPLIRQRFIPRRIWAWPKRS